MIAWFTVSLSVLRGGGLRDRPALLHGVVVGVDCAFNEVELVPQLLRLLEVLAVPVLLRLLQLRLEGRLGVRLQALQLLLFLRVLGGLVQEEAVRLVLHHALFHHRLNLVQPLRGLETFGVERHLRD